MISEGRWRGGRVERLSDAWLSVESDGDPIVAVDDLS